MIGLNMTWARDLNSTAGATILTLANFGKYISSNLIRLTASKYVMSLQLNVENIMWQNRKSIILKVSTSVLITAADFND